MMSRPRPQSLRVAIVSLAVLAAAGTGPWRLFAQAPEPAKGVKYAQISQADMKEWLSYLASDELQGRQVFTEGYGLAAAYIADHLKEWGIKPLGDDGTYFENVKLKGYDVTRNSTVTIDAGGTTKTFKYPEHVTFGANSGGDQTLTFDAVEFVGYGQDADFQAHNVKDKLVVWVPNLAPQAGGGAAGGRGGRGGRGANASVAAVNTHGAKAVGQFVPTPAAPTATQQALAQAQDALEKATQAVQQAQQSLTGRGAGGRGFGGGGGRGRGQLPPADLTTVQKVDNIVPPQFSGDETFFEALFAGGPVKFADVLAKAQKGEPIPPVTLPAKVTIKIDNTFTVVSEQLTRNVVGMIEGSDPKLKDTYVMFGAHLDHIGYSADRRRQPAEPERLPAARSGRAGGARGGGEDPAERGTPRRRGGAGSGRGRGQGAAAAPAGGRGAQPAVNSIPFDQRDFISNGADDDGSGSTAELAIAKAFATGPKPKRSIVFVWHTGEEAGLYGSRYNADFPVVPLDKVQAQLNMDMVGRDDCDNLEGDYTNSSSSSAPTGSAPTCTTSSSRPTRRWPSRSRSTTS